jgi:hypothetical protein
MMYYPWFHTAYDSTLRDAQWLWPVVAQGCPEYGVTIAPSTSSQVGRIGTTVTYLFQVANRGTITDTLDVHVNGNVWEVLAPFTTGPMEPGSTVSMEVDVLIPTSAIDGDHDQATVTVSSQGDPGQSRASTLTTWATWQRLYLPLVSR